MDIRDVALRYLAHRDHTVFEMKKHLREKGYQEEEILGLIASMLEFRYLDDYAFSQKYLTYAAKKGKALYRIKQELSGKGVSADIIQEALFQDSEEAENIPPEFERGLVQAEKTLGGQELTEKTMGKIGRRLAGLGYSTEIIYKIIGEMKRENREEKDD